MRPEEFQNQWSVSHETFARLQVYHDLLVKWQKAINLVSPKTIDEAWRRHFADSAQLASLIPAHAKTIADLGSGAGFPGLVLSIMRPDIKFHLVESDGKKCEFLKNVSHETSAKVTIHNERAEKILPDISADVITARAFAPLVKILKITEPAAQKNPDLSMLLLKGRGAAEEESAAREIYTFDAQYTPSRTEEGAQILAIANLHKKNPS